MSLEQHAFLEKSKVPVRQQWQTAIDQLELDMQLDPEFVPFKDSGFLPCKLSGVDSGFEVCFEGAHNVLEQYEHMRDRACGRDCCLSFRWGGDMRECVCVLIASAALARAFDALVYCPDDDLTYDADALLREARSGLGHIK